MVSAHFGHGVDAENLLISNLKKIRRAVSSVDAKIILSDLYDIDFQIYDHMAIQNASRPLSSVAFMPAEETLDTSYLKMIVNSYVDLDIRSHFGMSLEEFMNLPYPIASYFRELVKPIIERKRVAMRNIEDSLTNEKK